MSAVKQTTNKCLCCVSGPINVEASLEQTAYCCGENIRIKCEVQNGSDQEVTLFCRLIQVLQDDDDDDDDDDDGGGGSCGGGDDDDDDDDDDIPNFLKSLGLHSFRIFL